MRLAGWLASSLFAAGLVGAPVSIRAAVGEPCRVQGIEVSGAGSGLYVWVDGTAGYSSFTLADPPRIVLDLENALLEFPGSRLEGKGNHVQSVRYSQFAAAPRPVTRIVLDLNSQVAYRVESTEDGLEVHVGSGAEGAEASDPVAPAGATNPSRASSGAERDAQEAGENPAERDADAGDVAIVTYFTVSTVYVNAGRLHGLSEGDRLEVLHQGEVVGSLRVENLSSKRAACAVLDRSADLSIGDEIARSSVAAVESGGPHYLRRNLVEDRGGVAEPAMRNGSWLRQRGLRGRIGARYLAVLDRTSTRQSFHQPALDLRLDGRNVGGSAFDLSVDVRTRRTWRSTPDGAASSEGLSRVYRANAGWLPFDRKLSLTVGRQLAPEHPALGIFDGASLVLRTGTWSVGVLSGSQPDEVDFSYSDAIQEHGGFVQLRSGQGRSTSWSATVGAIASYAGGEINREYVSVQSAISSGPLSTYVSQDVDFNREWRLEAEGSSVSLTNTYVTTRLQATGQTALSAGYDNRRNVRLYRDYVSPETEFDDAYRQGYWGGLDQRFARIYRVSVRVKRSTGGSSATADSYTLSAAAQWPVALRARTTWFDNELVRGWVHSGAASAQLGASLRVEVGGGIRDETNTTAGLPGQYVRWYNTLVDYALGRSWYASVSFERSEDGPEANDQIYSMLNYRF